MNTFKNFGVGFKAYGKAFDIVFNKGLWYFLFFPLLLNILFLIAGSLGLSAVTNFIKDWLLNLLKFDGNSFTGVTYLQTILAYLSGIAGGFAWLLVEFIFFFIFTTFGGYIVIICLSPVFAILSEKTETILTGNKYPFNTDQLMRDIVRGVIIATRNMMIEFFYLIIFFVVGFIPIIGQFAAIVLFFISSYFYGFAFIDYTNERRRLSIKQSVNFIRKNKGMTIANGMVFSFFMFIPWCGVTLAGFVAIISVVAATIATHNVVNLSTNPYAQKNKQIEN